MNFTILMSLYISENEKNFMECMCSLFKQTVTITEIILVLDGELKPSLYKTLDIIVKNSIIPITIISLKKNVGLGEALNEGLKHCSNEWIFRMDTDDICLPDRFEKQISYIKENPHISLVGGNTEEFSEDMSNSNGQRNVACEHNDIIKLAKKRNPFNHMTVAFKKSAVLAVGGYQHHLYMEDYNLWLRMIAAGYKTHNLQDVLVNVRAGSSMVSRRRGLTYIKSEYQLAKLKIKSKIDSPLSATIIFFMRSIPRILPTSLLNVIYKKLRK
ncbi:glycosyltransferase [Morganella morganii]|uniref:glycosyltransferase n=1 Tax=Morganella morganii TaxID=582 RepID=UPI000D1F0F8F|nr:glycosyltransferase [Morganella morganii]QXO46318.1 glycosyltransferase [Morganella morganii]QXO53906.1 glycosyltransferase [Morganella morganii]